MTENPWTITSSDAVYDNKWIQITEHKVLNPIGSEGIYGVVHFKNRAIGIMVLDEAQNTYLIGQYRFPLQQYSWEIPEGGCPEDELPLEAAKRELKEETGIEAHKWTEILHMHLSNSVSDEFSVVFLAEELTFGNATPEETEVLQLKKVPFETLYQMVVRNEITDAITVAAVLKLKLQLLGH